MQKEKLMESMRQVDFSDLRFPLIAVYKKPKDYPDAYVARVWEGARNLPTNTLIKRKTLQEIRKDLRAAGFTTQLTPAAGEDQVIVEIWLR